MIRPMAREDIPTLIEMGRRFYEESPMYKIHAFSAPKLKWLGETYLNSLDYVALVYDKDGIQGMMAGCVYEQFFSRDLTASEMFLFVDQNRRGALIGKRLVEAFEVWAEAMGAKEIRVGVSAGIDTTRVVGFYQALGYDPTATQLRKVL
tara:strand:- start:378 stop:824 length:447 start_codon:yes stop_codon:yes gene_type:complete